MLLEILEDVSIAAKFRVNTREQSVHRRAPQFVLGGEMVQNDGLGNTGAEANFGGGRAVEAAAGKKRNRHVEDSIDAGSLFRRGSFRSLLIGGARAHV